MRKAGKFGLVGSWAAAGSGQRDAAEAAEASGEAPAPPGLLMPASGLCRRLENVRLLAAPPGPLRDAARSRGGRALSRGASRAGRSRAFGRHPRAAAVGNRLALPPDRPATRYPRTAHRDRAG